MQVDGLGGYYDGLGSIVLSANGMFNTPNKSAVLLEKGHKSMFWKKKCFFPFFNISKIWNNFFVFSKLENTWSPLS